MRKLTNNNKGAAVIALAVGASVAALILVGTVVKGVSGQRNLQRNQSLQAEHTKLMQRVTSVVLNDLRHGARFPDAAELPGHANSPYQDASGVVPCGARDTNDSCRYTLDAFLQATCQKTHLGYGSGGSKTIFYPRANFKVFTSKLISSRGVEIQILSDPAVIVSKVGPEMYSLSITFWATCPRQNLFSFSRLCGSSNQVELRYDGMINTNTNFFQGCPPCPRSNSGGCIRNPPVDGNFVAPFGCPAC